MRKARKNVQIGLGATSILMIFVILCMMILSVLSYSKAKQSESIAKRELNYKQAYQKANTKAKIIYELLKSSNDPSTSLQELMDKPEVNKRLKAQDITYHVVDNQLELNVKINDSQKLSILMNKTQQDIEKLRWKLISTGGNEYDHN